MNGKGVKLEFQFFPKIQNSTRTGKKELLLSRFFPKHRPKIQKFKGKQMVPINPIVLGVRRGSIQYPQGRNCRCLLLLKGTTGEDNQRKRRRTLCTILLLRVFLMLCIFVSECYCCVRRVEGRTSRVMSFKRAVGKRCEVQ